MKKFINTGDRLYPSLVLFALILLWQGLVSFSIVDSFILPYPGNVIKSLIDNFPVLMEHLTVTLQEAVYGLLAAVVISLVISFSMDLLPPLKRALYPLLLISQTVPVILLAPLFALWFGFGMLPKILVVVIVCFFPMVVSLIEGFEAVDVEEINLLKVMGADKFQIFRKVKFPSALVYFFSGLKVSATYSFMGAVISEWMGGKAGLGLYYLRAKKSYDIDQVFAVVLIIIAVSMMIFYTVHLIQYFSMPWQRKGKKDY